MENDQTADAISESGWSRLAYFSCNQVYVSAVECREREWWAIAGGPLPYLRGSPGLLENQGEGGEGRGGLVCGGGGGMDGESGGEWWRRGEKGEGRRERGREGDGRGGGREGNKGTDSGVAIASSPRNKGRNHPSHAHIAFPFLPGRTFCPIHNVSMLCMLPPKPAPTNTF